MRKHHLGILTMALGVPIRGYSKSWYGPPESAVFGILLAIILAIIIVNLVLSRLLKLIFEHVRQEKRKHLRFQLILGVGFSILFLFGQENWNWLNQQLTSISNDEYGPSPIIQVAFGLIGALIGSMIGYFVTPMERG